MVTRAQGPVSHEATWCFNAFIVGGGALAQPVPVTNSSRGAGPRAGGKRRTDFADAVGKMGPRGWRAALSSRAICHAARDRGDGPSSRPAETRGALLALVRDPCHNVREGSLCSLPRR